MHDIFSVTAMHICMKILWDLYSSGLSNVNH